MVRRLRDALTIDDLRAMSRRRVPRMFYQYCDSGSYTQSTMERNVDDFAKISLRQRIACDISDRNTGSTILGREVGMPLGLAPVGMTGMHHPDGEIAAAFAAEKAGVPFTLGTLSITPLEAVVDAVQAPIWFQLYVVKDRDFVRSLIDRAKAAQCGALVVTLDLQLTGQRHVDLRNGLSAPPKPSLSAAWQIGSKPGWCLRMLRTKHRSFGNIVGHVADVNSYSSIAEWTAHQFEPKLDWDMIKMFRDLWPGPLVLKGVQEVEDAAKCIEVGADALIVSNHGGRQLDGAASSISKLPAIAQAVGDKIEVYMDGGIRSGQDVLKAAALGARAAFIGRPYIFGLGAGGEAGVTRALDIIAKELSITMALCGLRTLDCDLSSIIDYPDSTLRGLPCANSKVANHA